MKHVFKCGYDPLAKIVVQGLTYTETQQELANIVESYFPETQVDQWKDCTALYPEG